MLSNIFVFVSGDFTTAATVVVPELIVMNNAIGNSKFISVQQKRKRR